MGTERKAFAPWRIVLNAIKLFGILVAIVSWHVELEHALNLNWVPYIFAPKYVRARDAYNQMLDDGLPLRANDAGFSEIISILREKISGPVEQARSVRIINTYWGVYAYGKGPRSDWLYTLELEIALQDGPQIVPNVPDLRPEINDILEHTLFGFAKQLLWLGIVVAVLADFGQGIIDEQRVKKRPRKPKS